MPEPPTFGHDERFVFCPRCGLRLEPQAPRPHEPPRPTCPSCHYVAFCDPKVAAGLIAEQLGGIVLVQRAIEPGYGRWVFPGGYVDRGERVEHAAAREMFEEACLHVRPVSLVGVYSYATKPVVVIVYQGEVTGGTLRAADESLDARTFLPHEIPWHELAFSSTFDALRDYLRRQHGIEPPGDAQPPESL